MDFRQGGFLPPPHSPALRSGDAVSPMLKSRKIKGLSPSDGLKTTLLDRLQFVGDKPGMLPVEFWLFVTLVYLITEWPSLGATCVSPAVFLAFGEGEIPAPERSGGERGGGRNPPPQRP
jgi:hypothetical protein